MSPRDPPTPLAAKLLTRIRREGPLSVAEYMQACLLDADHGYYRAGAPIGRGGDFTTAPEISQVFGEIIGLWCVVAWRAMGKPTLLRLIELGPGRGTLVSDMLRAARIEPAFMDAVRLQLVESNATLRQKQADALGASTVGATWHADWRSLARNLKAAPAAAAIVVANEFLDALPLEQICFRRGAWLQRCVGLDRTGAFAFVEGEKAHPLPTTATRLEPHDGDIFGYSPEQQSVAAELLGPAMTGAPLAALFLDFGHVRSGFGDTLAAIRCHAAVSPLDAPGETDLSAAVDFAVFADASRAAGLAVDGPVTQAEFLGSLGIIERASRLMAAHPGRAGEIEAQIARLMQPAGMGGRFKAMAVRSPALPPSPGFERGESARTGAGR